MCVCVCGCGGVCVLAWVDGLREDKDVGKTAPTNEKAALARRSGAKRRG